MLRRASMASGCRVVVIADTAKYRHARLHKQWREEHADDFALDYLPPYSPELNLIERVWKLTRRRCLYDRYFPMPEGVITAVESEFAGWAGPNESRRTLCVIIQDALFISVWSYGNGWGWMSSLRKHLDGDGAAVPWSRVAAVLAINRLCGPGSELAVEQHWYPSTALDDLLPIGDGKINDKRLYCYSLTVDQPRNLAKSVTVE